LGEFSIETSSDVGVGNISNVRRDAGRANTEFRLTVLLEFGCEEEDIKNRTEDRNRMENISV